VSHSFTLTFTALPEHIDTNDHVNNAVWVRWMEELAARHWEADANPAHVAAYGWVVLRHEIDYRGNVREGAQVIGTTQIRERPRGARFERHFSFVDDTGRELVCARTRWAMIDLAKGRPARIPAKVAAPFLPPA